MDKEKEKEISKAFHDLKQPLVALSGYIQLLELDLQDIDHNIEYVHLLVKALDELSISIEKAQSDIKLTIL